MQGASWVQTLTTPPSQTMSMFKMHDGSAGAGRALIPADKPRALRTHLPPPIPPLSQLQLVEPWKLKRGKGRRLASRQALLHSLVHIENWAVDLAWDIIARFGPGPRPPPAPRFLRRLCQGGWGRGPALLPPGPTPAGHGVPRGLPLPRRPVDLGVRHRWRVRWDVLPLANPMLHSAAVGSGHADSTGPQPPSCAPRPTQGGSLPARLAVEHCTHEARGLDVLPQTIHRFRSNGDRASATLLERDFRGGDHALRGHERALAAIPHAQAWAAREWPWPDRDGGGGTPAGSSGSQAEAAGGTPPHIPPG